MGKNDDGDVNISTTQDWTRGGNIPCTEFSALKMVDVSLLKGLEDFLRLIEYIKKNNLDLTISLNVVSLPQSKHFSRYNDGNIRGCIIVRIERQGLLPCCLIEIGRADNWSISTLVVKAIDNESGEDNAFDDLIHRLLQELLNNKGHWDKKCFRKENEYLIDTAKRISEQPIIRWAERIIEKI